MTEWTPSVDTGNFASRVLAADGPVLVDFWAAWCGPCKAVAPVLERIARQRNDLTVAKADVDAEPELALRYGVRSIPTLVLFDGGQVLATRVGAADGAEINRWLDETLAAGAVQ